MGSRVLGLGEHLGLPSLGGAELVLSLTQPTGPLSHSQKFLFFVLKSSDVLDILVPILYFLNDARADQCTTVLGLGCCGRYGGLDFRWSLVSLSYMPEGQAWCPNLPHGVSLNP